MGTKGESRCKFKHLQHTLLYAQRPRQRQAKTRSNPCLDEIVQAQAQAQGEAKQRPRSAAGRITIAAHLEVQP